MQAPHIDICSEIQFYVDVFSHKWCWKTTQVDSDFSNLWMKKRISMTIMKYVRDVVPLTHHKIRSWCDREDSISLYCRAQSIRGTDWSIHGDIQYEMPVIIFKFLWLFWRWHGQLDFVCVIFLFWSLTGHYEEKFGQLIRIWLFAVFAIILVQMSSLYIFVLHHSHVRNYVSSMPNSLRFSVKDSTLIFDRTHEGHNESHILRFDCR